jgi:hypothetical protein
MIDLFTLEPGIPDKCSLLRILLHSSTEKPAKIPYYTPYPDQTQYKVSINSM